MTTLPISMSRQKIYFKLVKELAEKEGITETLKASEQMEWVRQMNSVREMAMEIVNHEFVYA